MTSSRHGPYAWGYTHATMGVNNGMQYREVEPIQKYVLSSDCRLQLACMKLESLVTAGQQYGGEYVPGPCTHRRSRHESQSYPKSVRQPQGSSCRR